MDCFGNVNREKFRGFTIPLYRTPPTHTAAVQEIFQWLMGANGEFPHREQGEGAYWWRKELRRRLEAIGIDAATPPRDKES
jgi:hypothetical protein